MAGLVSASNSNWATMMAAAMPKPAVKKDEKSYEYCSWPASESYVKDQSVGDGIFETLKKATPHAIYGGVGADKPELRLIVAWDKTESHTAFTKSPEYAVLGGSVKKTFANPEAPGMYMVHIHFEEDPTKLFDAGVTEIVRFTPKEGYTLDDARAVVKSIQAKISGRPVNVGSQVGTIEEEPEKLLFLVGWKGWEEYQKFRQEPVLTAEFFGEIGQKGDIAIDYSFLSKKQ
ncbi:hypothetical protein PENSPDRAFT_690017 [Peniophora sp. CONT]|nr:hypothetical protein PENSPDRAFT_690017 [Peniophora sp. CONT]